MNSTITCPRCRNEFEVTEVIRTQLSDQIREELEAEAAAGHAALEAVRRQLEKEKVEIETARKGLDDQVRGQVEDARKELVTQARQQAKEDLAIELKDRDQQMDELRQKLKTTQDAELSLRKRERELQTRTEGLQLDVARQLDAEREKIRAEALKQSDQQHQFKEAEKERHIAELRRQIDDLKRKAEQGSQQLQGEVQELALEEMLRFTFPTDNVTPVPKGVCGGDSIQTVLEASGLSCGTILWESKRTRNWSHTWLAKLRDDQRAARATCAVIVSEALPDGVTAFALTDGVWVCSWSCVRALATALRVGLIEVAKSRLAVQSQHDKMELVYSYLSSREFHRRVSGVVEAFVSMQQDLESERRSMQRTWSKRDKQLQRALLNTAGLYGDLQGIIGASLPAIDGLSIPLIEHDARGEQASFSLPESAL